MNKTKYPCRQLNSKAIQSAALCFVSPIIVGKCSIVKAQCVCKIDEGGLQKAWNDVCRTRDACDKAICGKNLLFSMYYVAFRDYRSSFCLRTMFISLSQG
ncbi:hypothetical protein ABFA07_014914 [Porites harrisoni]